MTVRSAFILIVIGFLYLSCKKDEAIEEPPVQENQPDEEEDNNEDPTDTDTTTFEPVQRVLLENITAFRASNCPQANSIAQNLQTFYSDQLIEVRIHASTMFAQPTGSNPDEPYATDFRTESGNIYYDELFGNPGIPSGSVNRSENNGNLVMNSSAWNQAIEPIINLAASAEIVISVNSYNENTRQVDFDVEMEVLDPLETGAYYMTAYLIEDSIYDWQLNNSMDVENYLHRHILRDNVNGTWGELAFDTGASGQENTMSYQYALDSAWKEEHCSIVAYLHHGDTREIVQVNKAWIINP